MNLWNQYFEDCTVPSHPTSCPKCSEKVGRYQINHDEAVFMCSNKNCPWPFDSVQKAAEISGKSDINKLVKAMKLGGETDSDRDGLKEPYFHKKGEESTSKSSGSSSDTSKSQRIEHFNQQEFYGKCDVNTEQLAVEHNDVKNAAEATLVYTLSDINDETTSSGEESTSNESSSNSSC